MSAIALAIPGTSVPVGSQMSPSGAQGIAGTQGVQGNPGPTGPPSSMPGPTGPIGLTGATGPTGEIGPPPTTITRNAAFTVPAIDDTVQVQVEDARWIAIGQMVYVEAAGAGDAAGSFKVTAKSGNTLTLFNPEGGNGVPGKSVPLGSRISPAGPQGIPGTAVAKGDQGIDGLPGRASTVTVTAPFIVPAVGSTVQVEAEDARWVVAGQMIYVGNAGAGGEAGDFKVVSVSRVHDWEPWKLTLLNPPPGGQGPPGPAGKPFYGDAVLVSDSDPTRYSVDVGEGFILERGMQMFVRFPQRNSFTPQLNVNGSGEKALQTKTGVNLSGAELLMNGTYGLVYDGAAWRLTTPVGRSYSGIGGNTDVECSGYDSVEINIAVNAGCGLSLHRLGFGVPVTIRLTNSTAANQSYWVRASNASNEFGATWFILATALTGAGATRIDNSNTQNLHANLSLLFSGSLTQRGNEFALL